MKNSFYEALFSRTQVAPQPPVSALAGYLDEARALFAEAEPLGEHAAAVDERFDELRWFELPAQCVGA